MTSFLYNTKNGVSIIDSIPHCHSEYAFKRGKNQEMSLRYYIEDKVGVCIIDSIPHCHTKMLCQHFMYCLTTVDSDWKTAEFKYNTLIMYLVCYILANLSRRLIFELIVYTGIRRPSVRRPRPTLVAIATYSFRRLIMGKVEIDNFC